jgi:DNA repair protein RadC
MKSDRIRNWPKEERPRERLLAEGADKLTEAELLAIILCAGQGTFKEDVLGGRPASHGIVQKKSLCVLCVCGEKNL